MTEAGGWPPGPPLRVLPGLGLDARSWAPTLEVLGVSPDVVLTVPAFGEPARGDDLSPPALAERVVGLLPDRQPVLLAGHSSSSQVLAHVARSAPDRVTGLFLVGPTTDPSAATWSTLARRWLATARHEHPGQVPALLAQYSRTGLGTMARGMDCARRDRIDRTLAGVRCPVRVVRGRHDHLCPLGWAASLTADVVSLADGGHMVPWTHGSATAGALRAWDVGR